MSLTVTMHIFSGRPDPVWTLDDAAASELRERIERIPNSSNLKAMAGPAALGYRGFSVGRPETPYTTRIHAGIVDPGDVSPSLISGNHEIESWLLSTAGSTIPAEVKTYVEETLKRPAAAAMESIVIHPLHVCPVCHAADAPVYNPAIWNTPSVQPNNNCYNYANNQITNTFAQPGRATGHPITGLSCAGVQPSAQSDGLKPVANFSGTLTASHGWYVALVIWPGHDYHWYRQDKVGCWSHKPGGTAARNTDNSGNSISDPKTCDRGPYTVFCTYMITKHGVHIN